MSVHVIATPAINADGVHGTVMEDPGDAPVRLC